MTILTSSESKSVNSFVPTFRSSLVTGCTEVELVLPVVMLGSDSGGVFDELSAIYKYNVS